VQVKPADGSQADIDVLEALVRHAEVDPLRRAEIDAQILELQAAAAGRAEAVYEIEAHFGRSPAVATLHDLRIELDGRSARFDHVILNRVGEIWIGDSRWFRDGVSVSEHGEWARWWHGRRERIPSPIDQARRAAGLLARVFEERLVALPRRFGRVPMRPEMRTVLLVSEDARLTRPSRSVEGADQVLTVERLASAVRGGLAEASPIRLARFMAEEDLHEVAWLLAGLHRPGRTDWAARFGIPLDDAGRAYEEALPAERVEVAPFVAIPPPAAHLRSGHQCASCGGPVSWSAVKFCWDQPARFGRKVYCRSCQLNVQFPFGAPAPS
jgi:hypothetical protein